MICPLCAAPNREDSRFCSQCATPLTPTPSPLLPSATPQPEGVTLVAAFENLSRGTLFAGRYEIIEDLGRGGMGSVYKAFDRKLQEVVALKIIRPELGFNTSAVERFKIEVKNARKISHRNVCRLYDLGEAGLVHYLTMEYVEGEDLKKFIRRAGPIGTARALAISRQVAEGLTEAHRAGVVHRDLKPQNIMIDRDGRARIMDFGLSRFLDSEGMTGTGVMLGTPEYMSPEQVELGDVDGRSDLYAMGVILFEMVTGKVPFEGQTPLAVAIKHKNEKPPDARETNPLVPEPLVNIIYRCLEKDPGKRYPDAEALAADLAAVENDLPTIVREISRSEYRTPAEKRAAVAKPRRPRGLLWAGVAVAAILVPVLLIIATRPSRVVPPPSDGAKAMVTPDARNRAENAKRSYETNMGLASGVITLSRADALEQSLVEKFVDGVKVILPEKGPYVDAWNNLAEEIRKRKLAVPPPPGSRPAHKPSAGASLFQGDMQKLLALVAERDSALAAKQAVGAAKAQAQKAGAGDRNMLFRLARYEEGNADDAFSKNDFSGSKALYRVLEKVYALSSSTADDAAAVEAMAKIVSGLKAEIGRLPTSAVDSWLFEYARETESQARAFREKKDAANACGAFLRSAFLFQKAKDSA